jgi:hypothetical protein
LIVQVMLLFGAILRGHRAIPKNDGTMELLKSLLHAHSTYE